MPQRLGHDYAAIRLLESFHESHKQSRERRSAPVQDVRKAVLALLCLEPQIHAAGLKILAIRNARNLQVTPLPWRPNLYVVSFGTGESHVSCAKQNHPIMQTEQLQHSLRVREHLLLLFVPRLWLYNFDQFNFVE